MPIIKAKEKSLVVSAPTKNKTTRTKIVVSEVLMDRTKVWLMLSPTICSNGFLLCVSRLTFKFSRTLSKTTMVSWTEKPRTTSRAVTNKVSTSTPWKCPRTAKTPAGIKTSCTKAKTVIKPYFQEATGSETLRKAKVMKRTIQTITKIMENNDLRTASLPSKGPTESNLSSVIFLLPLLERAWNKIARSDSSNERVLIR